MHDKGRYLCEDVSISVSGGSDRVGSRAARESLAVFGAVVFGGAGWTGIGGLYPDARAACLCVVTRVGLRRPGVSQAGFRERAEVAVRTLEDGAVSVPVIDGRYRVDRVEMCPGRRSQSRLAGCLPAGGPGRGSGGPGARCGTPRLAAPPAPP
jgi:hypothetical protein